MPQHGIKTLVAGSIFMIGAGLFAPSWAADNVYEDMYKQYHRAKRVAELCRDITMDQGMAAKFGQVIDAKTGHQIGGGRSLTLLYQAKDEAYDIVNKQGCGSAEAQGLLQIYDTELVPALSQ